METTAAQPTTTTETTQTSEVKDPKAIEQKLPATDYKGTKHKVKTNEVEEEIEYDELIKGYQKAKASDIRFQEAARIKKEAQQEREEIEKDLWGYVKKKGKDPHQLAEDLLLEKIKFEQMTPIEKELLQERQKRESIERELANKTEKEKELLRSQYEEQAYKDIDSEISAALKEVGKKPTPRLIAEMALTMLAHHESGGNKIPAKEALGISQRNITAAVQEYLENLSLEDAQKSLPKKLLDGLYKNEMDRRVSQNNPYAQRNKDVQIERPLLRRKAASTDEFFTKLEKKWSK